MGGSYSSSDRLGNRVQLQECACSWGWTGQLSIGISARVKR
jgi:hypothetical protein